MNYYNPYFNVYPYYGMGAANIANTANTGLFGRLFGGLNLSSILSGAQKTLNIANQTIPLIKQVQPMMHNAKTMFKVMNEFKKFDSGNTPDNSTVNRSEEKAPSIDEAVKPETNGPTFFQ